MATEKLPTKFAPAERAATADLARQAELFTNKKKLLGLLPDTQPCILLILNECRQIVFANERFLELVPEQQRRDGVLGRRLGEVLGCSHAFEDGGGCGTSEACFACGAVNAILSGLSGQTDMRECRILREKTGEALDLRVWTTPVTVNGKTFATLAALDISHEKRRQSLEHIFLHDICNVAYGLSWYAGFLKKANPDQVPGYVDAVGRLCRQLIEEIDAQRILMRAEAGEVELKPESLSSLQLVRQAVELYREHPVALNRELCIDPQAEDVSVVGDHTLLSRVLCNLLKNALEACKTGETVTAGCMRRDGAVEFQVHNPGVMPREVQLQIFQRSFSTKGIGRGLGTYSIKLLTERYLHGHVSFTSAPETGTTFQVRYPLAPLEM
ncbi:MAG: HAMP domain-containing histidine kinase [Planctomycetes bacterium]|jgi:signal transduction histidine kinase|nr:HAMP domain-containing histidine kinase [Planctomycetota bacterium]